MNQKCLLKIFREKMPGKEYREFLQISTKWEPQITLFYSDNFWPNSLMKQFYHLCGCSTCYNHKLQIRIELLEADQILCEMNRKEVEKKEEPKSIWDKLFK